MSLGCVSGSGGSSSGPTARTRLGLLPPEHLDRLSRFVQLHSPVQGQDQVPERSVRGNGTGGCSGRMQRFLREASTAVNGRVIKGRQNALLWMGTSLPVGVLGGEFEVVPNPWPRLTPR